MPASMWLAVACAVLAMIGALVLLKGTDGVPVAVATRPLVAGETVSAGDFRFVDGGALPGMLTAADVATIGGHQAARPIPEGAPVTKGDLLAPGTVASPRALSIPVDPSHAVGGKLAAGDTVDVIDASGVTGLYVVTGATVLAVGDTSGSKLAGASAHYAVTITVDEASALRVAAAITAGKVEIVRSTGAPAIR